MTSTKRQAPDDKHQMTSTKRQVPKDKHQRAKYPTVLLEVEIRVSEIGPFRSNLRYLRTRSSAVYPGYLGLTHNEVNRKFIPLELIYIKNGPIAWPKQSRVLVF